MIDTHCHLDRMPAEALADWFARGLEAVIAPSTDMASLEKILALARRWPGRVLPAAGVHPENAPSLEEAEAMAAWIDGHHGEIIAIGEVGLPWYSLPFGGDIPTEAFAILDLFLDQAIRWDLPVILHAVHGTAAPCLEHLRTKGVRRAVFHWLKAPEDVLLDILTAGYWVSVTPEITVLKRDQALAKQAFPNRLLLETDGPEPLRTPQQGPSTPLWVNRSAQWLAQQHNLPPEEVQIQMDANARHFFHLRPLPSIL